MAANLILMDEDEVFTVTGCVAGEWSDVSQVWPGMAGHRVCKEQ